MDRLGLAENTVIVLWGDHGWHRGEKESWRKMTLWERGTKTPLIFSVPGMTPVGQASTKPVSLQDLFPTLVELCGLPDLNELDGNTIHQR